MFVPADLARQLLVRLPTVPVVKARSLVMIDDKYANSPFPYDKRFFKKIRPDQVPRFLRCLTDPQKLPERLFRLDHLYAIQDRVEVAKIESIRAMRNGSYATVVKLREDGDHYIIDGLHRSTVDWLSYEAEAVFRYCDLSDHTKRVEPVPGAGAFTYAEQQEKQ